MAPFYPGSGHFDMCAWPLPAPCLPLLPPPLPPPLPPQDRTDRDGVRQDGDGKDDWGGLGGGGDLGTCLHCSPACLHTIHTYPFCLLCCLPPCLTCLLLYPTCLHSVLPLPSCSFLSPASYTYLPVSSPTRFPSYSPAPSTLHA